MKSWFIFILTIVLIFPLCPCMRASAEAGISAQAAILMEAGTFEILYEKNAREKRSMASTTKIMTTLLTLESGDLDTPFTVDPKAIRVEGSSMGLQEGDTVTRRALCYGMLLPSGNDAANAAAVSVAGSIPAFAERMNQRATEIGMSHTCFVTPSGLEGEGHGSSAYDMALLTREALQNPEFAEICCQRSVKLRFGNPPYDRTLYNSNKLLSMYEGVIGVKTGFTDEAGRCLVSACKRDGITLICVTLNAPDDWNDHMCLYDMGFSMLEPRTLALPEHLTIPAAGGSNTEIPLKPKHPVTVGWKKGAESDITVIVKRFPFAWAPVHKGDVLGTLEYRRGGRIVAQVKLLADAEVPAQPPKPLTWREKLFRQRQLKIRRTYGRNQNSENTRRCGLLLTPEG